MQYLILTVWLVILGLVYLQLPAYRLLTAVFIGISYFLWGVFVHRKDRTLLLPVVLEYLAIALLGITILIFISLRS